MKDIVVDGVSHPRRRLDLRQRFPARPPEVTDLLERLAELIPANGELMAVLRVTEMIPEPRADRREIDGSMIAGDHWRQRAVRVTLPRFRGAGGGVHREALVLWVVDDLDRRRAGSVDEEGLVHLQVRDRVKVVREEHAGEGQPHFGVARGREDDTVPEAMVLE